MFQWIFAFPALCDLCGTTLASENVYILPLFSENTYINPSEVFWIPKANFQKDIYNHAECLLCTFEIGEILISFSNMKLLGP